MNKKILMFLFWTVFVLKATAQETKHVVLITIDGLRPDFYLDASYGMFNLRHYAQSGSVVKEVVPVFPSMTLPDHSSLVSGVKPNKHGIYYNGTLPRYTDNASWNYNDIKCATIWSALHGKGLSSACVLWPVTVNAPIDYRASEDWGDGGIRLSTTGKNHTIEPSGLWQALQDSATGVITDEDHFYHDDELVMDENAARWAGYIIEKHRPNFIAVHFGAVDHYQHVYGREAYMVHAAVAGADRCIKTLMESIGRAHLTDSTVVIVTGDHGMENVNKQFHPNYLLKKAGLLDTADIQQSKAWFYLSGGSAFLYLRDPHDFRTASLVRRLFTGLPDSIHRYFKIIDKRQLQEIGADSDVSLALSGLDGAEFGSSLSQIMNYLPKVHGNHGYYPDHHNIMTGFVVWGPNILSGNTISSMSILDVAPFIGRLLDVSLPLSKDSILTKVLRGQNE